MCTAVTSPCCTSSSMFRCTPGTSTMFLSVLFSSLFSCTSLTSTSSSRSTAFAPFGAWLYCSVTSYTPSSVRASLSSYLPRSPRARPQRHVQRLQLHDQLAVGARRGVARLGALAVAGLGRLGAREARGLVGV